MVSQEKEEFCTDVLLSSWSRIAMETVPVDLPIHSLSAPTHSSVHGVNCIGYAAVKQDAQPEDKALLTDIPSTDICTLCTRPYDMYVKCIYV